MHVRDPVFPPLFSGHGVRAPNRPLTEALKGAQTGTFGAGDVVWARNTRLLDMALVLEPEVERDRVCEVLCVAAVAVGDAIGAIAPPEVAITWNWPGVLLANNARFGQIGLEVAPENDDDGCPQWLVLGIEMAIWPAPDGPEPGLFVDRTTLADEGCVDLDRSDFIEAWSRHFLTWLNTWNEDGFGPVHEAYLFRANHYRSEIEIDCAGETVRGTFSGLDDHGNMLVKTEAGDMRLLTIDAMLGIHFDKNRG